MRLLDEAVQSIMLSTVWLVLSTQVVTVMEFEGYMLELGH